jgi:hypothetical protein
MASNRIIAAVVNCISNRHTSLAVHSYVSVIKIINTLPFAKF